MRFFLRVINEIADTLLAWFTPIWRRQGHEAVSLIARYMNQYRPQIKEEKRAELQELQAKLKEAMLYWRKTETEECVKKTQELADTVPGFRRTWYIELVESLFVITVVFLGIRTYYLQPFRIPTNSMWPSLNGIVIHPVDEEPGMARRVWDAITLGSSYVNATAEKPKSIVNLEERRVKLLFTETVLHFDDGSELAVPSASGAVMQYLRDRGIARNSPMGLTFRPYQAGETIMRARVDAGDMVLVNRVAYHFRRPRRGETFVFDTRGINTSMSSSATMKDQSGGTHFIKRLCALPGDRVSIQEPNVIIDGKVCSDGGMRIVEQCQAPYNDRGYVPLDPWRSTTYLPEGRTATLSKASPRQPWLREYLALGDNTLNSLDSRYWGPVRQFNVLGPASFTLWPFTAHWGSID